MTSQTTTLWLRLLRGIYFASKACVAALFAFLALCGHPAPGGVVFFDDFDGNALLPHWNQPPPEFWEQNVSNGMLNVTGLFEPSSPKSPSNFAHMNAEFAPQADFRVDVWMGWEPGPSPHRLDFWVLGPFGANPILAEFGYRNEFPGDPVIFARAGTGPPVTMPAPLPGIHQFTITRTGAQVNFYLNETPFTSIGGTSKIPAAFIAFEFLGPYPGELGAFHVDRVQVIPAPSALLLAIFPLVFGRNRRRRG